MSEALPSLGLNFDMSLGWRLYPAYGAWRPRGEPALFTARPTWSLRRARDIWAAGLSGRLHLDRRTARCTVELTTAGPSWSLHGEPGLAGLGFGLRAVLEGSPSMGYQGGGLLRLGEVTEVTAVQVRPAPIRDADGRLCLEATVGLLADPSRFRVPRPIRLALHCRFLPDSPEWSAAPSFPGT